MKKKGLKRKLKIILKIKLSSFKIVQVRFINIYDNLLNIWCPMMKLSKRNQFFMKILHWTILEKLKGREENYSNPVWENIEQGFKEPVFMFKMFCFLNHMLCPYQVHGWGLLFIELIFIAISHYLGKFRGRLHQPYFSFMFAYCERIGLKSNEFYFSSIHLREIFFK